MRGNSSAKTAASALRPIEKRAVYSGDQSANMERAIKTLAHQIPEIKVTFDSVETRKQRLAGLIEGKSDYFVTVTGPPKKVDTFFSVLNKSVEDYNKEIAARRATFEAPARPASKTSVIVNVKKLKKECEYWLELDPKNEDNISLLQDLNTMLSQGVKKVPAELLTMNNNGDATLRVDSSLMQDSRIDGVPSSCFK